MGGRFPRPRSPTIWDSSPASRRPTPPQQPVFMPRTNSLGLKNCLTAIKAPQDRQMLTGLSAELPTTEKNAGEISLPPTLPNKAGHNNKPFPNSYLQNQWSFYPVESILARVPAVLFARSPGQGRALFQAWFNVKSRRPVPRNPSSPWPRAREEFPSKSRHLEGKPSHLCLLQRGD